jgi:hypothetical protein
VHGRSIKLPLTSFDQIELRDKSWLRDKQGRALSLLVIRNGLLAVVYNAHGGRSNVPNVFHVKGVFGEEMLIVAPVRS